MAALTLSSDYHQVDHPLGLEHPHSLPAHGSAFAMHTNTQQPTLRPLPKPHHTPSPSPYKKYSFTPPTQSYTPSRRQEGHRRDLMTPSVGSRIELPEPAGSQSLLEQSRSPPPTPRLPAPPLPPPLCAACSRRPTLALCRLSLGSNQRLP